MLSACQENGISGSDAGLDTQQQNDGSGDGSVSKTCSLAKGNPETLDPNGTVTLKNVGEATTVEFSTGSEEFLLVPYSASTEQTEAIDFSLEITDSGKTDVIRSKLTQPPVPSLKERNPKLWAYWQKRLSVEKWTRSLIEQAAKMKLSSKPAGSPSFNHPAAGGSCSLSSECEATEVCHKGTCQSAVQVRVSAIASESKTETIETAVAKKGTLAAILVDKNSEVSTEDVDKLLQTFESIIYPRDVALFGNPPLESGKTKTSSDRNGDGLVWLVLTNIVQEKEGVGFFVATDFTEDAKSNQADILYVLPPSEETPVEQTFGILAHEFQHLLNFGTKVYRAKVNGNNNAAPEALWLDEGLSHFAEDALGYGGENVTLLAEHAFLGFGDKALLATESADDSLTLRGLAFTFVRYLFERKGGVCYAEAGEITDQGGAAWLKSLHSSTEQGVELVTKTYGEFAKAFQRWMMAMSLSNRGVSDYVLYNFDPLIEDPVTKNMTGLLVRGTRKDHTGASVKLEGPVESTIVESTDETIPNSAAKLFRLQGKQGSVTVKLTSEETALGYAVIKLK